MVERRSFLKLFVCSPALIPAVSKLLEQVQDVGFRRISFSDVITSTLKSRSYLLEENISRHNPLYIRLTKSTKL